MTSASFRSVQNNQNMTLFNISPTSTMTSFSPWVRRFFYASLIPFFPSDAVSPPQRLMATINTVNFDDLFDFSPEPLELQSSPNPHASIAATAAVPRSVRVLIEIY